MPELEEILLIHFYSVCAVTVLCNVLVSQASGQWPDPNQEGLASARAYKNDAQLLVAHTHSAGGNYQVALPRAGVNSIDRVDLGVHKATYVISGVTSNGVGFVQAVKHDNYSFDTPLELWMSASNGAHGVGYSPAQGRLYAFVPSTASLIWCAFNPSSPAVGTWQAIPVDVSGLPSLVDHNFGLEDDGGNTHISITPNDPRAPGIEIRMAGTGPAQQFVIPPVAGTAGLSRDVIVNNSAVDGFGRPNEVVEVYSRNTGVIYGSATVGGDGLVSIPVSAIPIGDILGLRKSGTSDENPSQRIAFKTWGVTVGVPGSLLMRSCGSVAAHRAVVGDSEFSVDFRGVDLVATSPSTFQAYAVVGTESDIVFDPNTQKYTLSGPGAIAFSETLERDKGWVSGEVDLPIPDDPNITGTTFCLQWLVGYGGQLVCTNIASVMIQPVPAAASASRTSGGSQKAVFSSRPMTTAEFAKWMKELGGRPARAINWGNEK